MLHVQEYLKTHSYEDLKDEFDIKYKLYDDRISLKYGIKSPKYHPITLECRGLVLSVPEHEIISRPFDRFFNLGEGEDYIDFNWDKCHVFTKYDGSICHVSNYKDKWYVSTSGTAFAEGETPMGKTYYDLFLEAIDGDLQDIFQDLPDTNTYIFELVSPENRIVTPYKETKVILLAIRNKITGEYIPYELIEKNKHIFYFCELAKSFNLNKKRDIVKFVNSLPQLEEGVVCYDPETQKRIKIKSPIYVSIHHLKGNEVTHKSITTLLLQGEMDEYLTYFPETKDFMQPYIDKFNNLKQEIIETFNKYQHIEDQKEFALTVKKFKYSSFLFQLRRGKTINELFNIDNLNYLMKLLTKEK